MASSHDREILRRLAGQVRQIAEHASQAPLRELWYRHNALQSMRPMVLCFPEGAWEEILPLSSCQCEDAQLRGWERRLRMQIFQWEHIRDDQPVEPFFNIPWRIQIGDYGFQVPYTHGDQRGSYIWEAPIKDLDRQLDQLHFRPLEVDRPGTLRDLALAQEVFGALLPPRVRGTIWWTLGLSWEAIKLIGLEPLMLNMYDNPAGLHRLMAFLRDEHLHLVQWCREQGVLSPMSEGDYTGSGGLGYSRELSPAIAAGEKVKSGKSKVKSEEATDYRLQATGRTEPGLHSGRLTDLPINRSTNHAINQLTAPAEMWGFAESQETVGVSPQMFGEFILPYQRPLLEQFGLNCYGCCEGLEHRIDLVLRGVPRLRRVSVAPLANQQALAEKLAGRYIFSRKVDPVKICLGPVNEDSVRAELRQTLELAGGGPLELILKDTHTVEHDGSRPGRWVQIAREEIERYAGDGGRRS